MPDEKMVSEKRPVEKTVQDRKSMAQTNFVSERKPFPANAIRRIDKSLPDTEKSVPESIIRNKLPSKSVIKRGEIKKTTGKNIVIRRPGK